jgi:hypothetical protein
MLALLILFIGFALVVDIVVKVLLGTTAGSLAIMFLMGLIAVSFLTVLMTMKEGNLKTVRSVLIFKMMGLITIFWGILVAFLYFVPLH